MLAAWAWAVLGAACLLRGRPEVSAVVLVGALLLGPGAAGMLGQREHLFLFLAFPSITPRAAGVPAEDRLAVEAVALLREGPQRWIRPSGPWPLAAGPAAHALAVVLGFSAYLTDALPWLLGLYQAMGWLGPWEMLALAPWGFWTALGLALAGLAVAPRRSAPWVVAVWTALGPAAPGQGLELPLAADPVAGRRPGGERTQAGSGARLPAAAALAARARLLASCGGGRVLPRGG